VTLRSAGAQWHARRILETARAPLGRFTLSTRVGYRQDLASETHLTPIAFLETLP